MFKQGKGGMGMGENAYSIVCGNKEWCFAWVRTRRSRSRRTNDAHALPITHCLFGVLVCTFGPLEGLYLIQAAHGPYVSSPLHSTPYSIGFTLEQASNYDKVCLEHGQQRGVEGGGGFRVSLVFCLVLHPKDTCKKDQRIQHEQVDAVGAVVYVLDRQYPRSTHSSVLPFIRHLCKATNDAVFSSQLTTWDPCVPYLLRYYTSTLGRMTASAFAGLAGRLDVEKWAGWMRNDQHASSRVTHGCQKHGFMLP